MTVARRPLVPQTVRPTISDHPGGRTQLHGFPLDVVSFQETISRIESAVRRRETLRIATANLDFIAIARRDSRFVPMLVQFDLVVPDGVPLCWLLGLVEGRACGRVNGTELVDACAAVSARTTAKVALVGSPPDIAATAARVLRVRHPGASVVVVRTPELASAKDAEAVAAATAEVGAKIVLVGLGAPRQEEWLLAHLERTGAHVGIGVGGSFEILGGARRRAPEWMRRSSLEWAWRMLQEPRRLAPRYLLRDLPAALPLVAGVSWDWAVAVARRRARRDDRTGSATGINP